MVAPNSGNSLDVVLNIIMNETGLQEGAERSEKSVDDLKDKVSELEKTINTMTSRIKEWEKAEKELGREFAVSGKQFTEKGRDVRKELNLQKESIRFQKKQLEEVKGVYKKLTDEVKKHEKAVADEISMMQKEAGALNALAGARAKEIDLLRQRADFIERGSTALFAGGVAGITAIVASAKQYIDAQEESNELTKAWAENSERVRDAQLRIGKVSAEAVLPLFEKLASIAEKAADFVEKNPSILEAGLKASIVAAGLGGIGLLVSKGIKLYADIKMIAVGNMQLTAAKIMSDAANKQLLAARGSGGNVLGKGLTTGGATTAGGTVAGSGAASAGGVVAGGLLASLAGIIAGVAVNDALAASGVKGFEKSNKFATVEAFWVGSELGKVAGLDDAEIERKATVFAALVGKVTGAIDENAPLWVKASEMADRGNKEFIQKQEENNELLKQQRLEHFMAIMQIEMDSREEELKHLQEFGTEKLRGIVQQINEERIRRREGFVKGIGDLAEYLKLDRNLKQTVYDQMVVDIKSFGDKAKSIISDILKFLSGNTGTAGVTQRRAGGGYASYGMYLLGDSPSGGPGPSEYVIKGQTARSMERMIGGRISDQFLLQSVSNMSNKSLQYNDFRRINNGGTGANRRQSQRDTLEVMTTLLEKANGI